jgi:DNA-binding CsgD family transcriptional regulator
MLYRSSTPSTGFMQHLIFIYYITSLSAGFAGILMTFLLYLKFRMKIFKYYISLMILFTIYLVLLNVHYYQRTVILFDSDLVHTLATAISSVAIGMMYFIIPLAVHRFVNIQMSRKKKVFFILLALLPFIVNTILSPLLEDNTIGSIVQKSIIYGILAYALFLSLKYYKDLSDKKKLLIKLFIIIMAVFIPLQIIDDIRSIFIQTLYPVTVLPFFYFICNMISIIFAFKYLFINPAGFIAGGINDRVLRKYKVTEREKEIISLIAEGYANKQIAQKLGISFSTVKNHIYNIFQKTKTRGKIELLRRLNDKMNNF